MVNEKMAVLVYGATGSRAVAQENAEEVST